jgi:exodeoxyribonuclease V gamma subunit
VVFPSVPEAVEQAVTAGGGVDRQGDPWQADRLVWTLLDLIDYHVGESWCDALGAYLGATHDSVRRGRHFATARHLAELFDSYGRHRPSMMTS